MLFLYQTRQGSYSVITKKQTAMFNDLFYLVTGILGNDSNLLIVFYVQIMPDDLVMQLHRF